MLQFDGLDCLLTITSHCVGNEIYGSACGDDDEDCGSSSGSNKNKITDLPQGISFVQDVFCMKYIDDSFYFLPRDQLIIILMILLSLTKFKSAFFL